MLPVTFIAAVNNEQILRYNFLSSPCLDGHQVILQRDAKSAADSHNAGLAQAKHPLVVFLHQDVWLPEGWPELLYKRWAEAEKKFGKIGAAGIYGIGEQPAGHLRDGAKILREPVPLPAKVRSLDECLLILPRDTALRFDPTLGWHFYGTDIALQAAEAGENVIVLDAFMHHNHSYPGGKDGNALPSAFYMSGIKFAAKWRPRGVLPIRTSCTVVV